jgi:hypothetical protein
MSNLQSILSVTAIVLAVVAVVYVYREMSHTRQKVGEIRYLKNTLIDMKTDLEGMKKVSAPNKVPTVAYKEPEIEDSDESEPDSEQDQESEPEDV